MEVSKIEVAERLLETAIKLYFDEEDPCSIHLLGLSAYDILRDLCKKKGLAIMSLKDLTYINSNYKQEIRELFNKYQNFFKHADRDPNASVEFKPETTDVFLFQAVECIGKMKPKISPYIELYRIWFIFNNQNMFSLSKEEEYTYNEIAKDSMNSRHEFKDVMLEVIRQYFGDTRR